MKKIKEKLGEKGDLSPVIVVKEAIWSLKRLLLKLILTT